MISDRGLERDAAAAKYDTGRNYLRLQENRDSCRENRCCSSARDSTSERSLHQAFSAITARLVILCFGFGEAVIMGDYATVEIEVWTVGTTDISNWDQLTPTLQKPLA